MSEPKKLKEKLEYFFGNYWNIFTSLAIIMFLIGFGFRIYPPTRLIFTGLFVIPIQALFPDITYHNSEFSVTFTLTLLCRSSVGRVILAVDSVLWSMKLLDFLSVHPRFGPYTTMAAKMVCKKGG